MLSIASCNAKEQVYHQYCTTKTTLGPPLTLSPTWTKTGLLTGLISSGTAYERYFTSAWALPLTRLEEQLMQPEYL